MINNRQSGRRRGRGGGGNGGGNQGGQRQGRADNGNRIDNRARGNAAQLLEKYKNLASDAQRQGDRVNTEYYLQFADHYFRVLADQRGRFEDQQPRRQRDDFDGDRYGDGDDDFADEGEPIRAGEQQMEARAERQERSDRPERGDRQDRGDRPTRDRGDRGDRDRQPERFERRPRRDDQQTEVGGQHRADAIGGDEPLGPRAEQVLEADAPLAAPARRRGRPRRDAGEAAEPVPGLDADRLPPSLMTPANDAGDDEAPKPRRRGRPPRAAAEAPAAE